MHLWLLCCVLLFLASQGYEWISHQAWFMAPELALPWVVLGGIGLAIASNRATFAPLLSPPRRPAASSVTPSTASRPAAGPPPPTAPKAVVAQPTDHPPKSQSVSFKISRKPISSESS
ncbi:MAG: hypothetical protein AAFO87_01110 [Cyanobacteria bacterium J06607_6]